MSLPLARSRLPLLVVLPFCALVSGSFFCAPLKQGQNSITQAIAENELLQMMNHHYVVSLHCSFQDSVNLYMVLDYAGGGDLFALIDKRCAR